ncbi:MAG: hypothetical protein BGO82_10700 [Devosia sp. 67-54]|uniref:hypothetical protein n=1 Tax=unclassified Devosia TaxID=196773 RepID=UPI0009682FC3|nr:MULTISPECIES: hypothetical protein [unclassified Devosia]MBN9304896.1 hypothetical protein [Devosia sp.]OJX15152.1 MAG: hypothetical protein BGO82_10700 [Devosia sp. 67-54]
MMQFDDSDDVEEWLETLGYEDFWTQADLFVLELCGQSRACCDRQIASGSIDANTVLDVLKGMARLELIERFSLKPRDIMPWYSLH